MSSHLHSVTLYESPTVTVRDVRCRPRSSECGGEEFTPVHEIVFPRSGVFVKHVSGREVIADANHILFFGPSEPYRVSHPLPGGDDCTVYVFPAELLAEAAAEHDPSVRDRPEQVFQRTHVASRARTVLLHQSFRRQALGGVRDPLDADECALELLADVMDGLPRSGNPARTTQRSATLRAHREFVHAVQTHLSRHFHRPLRLADVAKAVHCSPFHLARVFRRQSGVSIHRYANRLRLREGVERIVEGEEDLSHLALDLGFSSHSHFSDVFRREFSLTPREFRRAGSLHRSREMSKILKVASHGAP